jgi:flagellin
MSFSVVTNIASLNSQTQLTKTTTSLQNTLARLSSGLRINSAADDAAGLAVANRFRMDNAGLAVGIRAANDGISRLQIEDGAMNNISFLLDRALTLAAQSASDTFIGDRDTLDEEFQSVLSEITRTAEAAGLETGSANLDARSVFVGNTQIATSTNVTYISFAITTAVDSEGLGISTQAITSQTDAVAAIAALQSAVATLGTAQGRVGAAMNRLQFAVSQAQTMSVAVAASESRIRDANMAEEAAALTRYTILNQSGLASLAQANQISASVLSLLQ